MHFVTETDRINANLGHAEAREREVEHYQFNIDNMVAAAAKLKARELDAAETAFLKSLEDRVAEERRQQFTAKLMLEVALDKLKGHDIPALIEARKPKRSIWATLLGRKE